MPEALVYYPKTPTNPVPLSDASLQTDAEKGRRRGNQGSNHTRIYHRDTLRKLPDSFGEIGNKNETIKIITTHKQYVKEFL